MTNDTYAEARIALITGGSRGLGRALTTELLRAGWRVVTDGRDPLALTRLLADAPNPKALIAVLGPSPLPALAGYPSTHSRRSTTST